MSCPVAAIDVGWGVSDVVVHGQGFFFFFFFFLPVAISDLFVR